MAENQTQNQTETTQETLSPEEALAKLMRESVPKAQYDALQKQYNDFFSKVASGRFTEEDEGEREPSEDEKQQQFFKAVDTIYHRKFHGSKDFMDNALIIDNYLTSHGQRSAFAPSRGDITADIENQCEAFNKYLQECIDNCGGDDSICSANFASAIDTPFKNVPRS